MSKADRPSYVLQLLRAEYVTEVPLLSSDPHNDDPFTVMPEQPWSGDHCPAHRIIAFMLAHDVANLECS